MENGMVSNEENSLDFQQIWNIFVGNRKWFVASVAFFLLVAFAFLWLKPAKVSVSAKLRIMDKQQQDSRLSAGMAMLNSLPMGIGSSLSSSLGSGGTETEKEILMSNTLLHDVANDLRLHTECRLCNLGSRTLLYQNEPLLVSVSPTYLKWLDSELPLMMHQVELTITKDEEGYTVETVVKENNEKEELPDQRFATLPATILIGKEKVVLSENPHLRAKDKENYKDGYTVEITIVPPMTKAMEMMDFLTVESPATNAPDIVSIKLEDEHVVRGIDILNRLVEVYNQYANDEKNEEANKTDAFVKERLAKIDAELGSSDEAWEKSKKNYQITDPKVDAQEVIQKKSIYESQIVEISTQLQLHDYLNEYINNPENLFEIIPSGLGGIDFSNENASSIVSSQASLIAQHNNLVNQRKVLLKSMSEKAPQVERLSETIKELHPTLQTAMRRDRQNLIMKRSALEREYGKYMGRVSNTPQMERVLTEIGRQREIKQGVYLLMLQKREETAMALANTADKGKLLGEVQMEKNSKHPKKKVVLLAALIMGVIFPMPILFFYMLFKSRIDIREELSSLTGYPLLGEVTPDSQDESICKIRTNLLRTLMPGQKVVLVTSERSGDGKTHVARQLVDSLSRIGKKAHYLDLDLRKPPQAVHPADYFESDDFKEMISFAKSENDLVLFDTPSIDSWFDAYQLAQFADATLFVVKSGTTHKSMVKHLNEDIVFPHKMLVMNTFEAPRKSIRWFHRPVSLLILSLLMLMSCMSTKHVPYFLNADEIDLSKSEFLYDAKIMPKDILQIKVFSMTPGASEIFNLEKLPSSYSSAPNTSQNPVYNYLVGNDGNITFPVIGEIHVGGLTKSEAEDLIKSKIAPYMSESEKFFVHVRMLNYKYSVIGEVRRPGTFSTQNEKVNIIEAIAQAGDLTLYGLRDRVFLIRENSEGRKEYHRLNLNDANIVSSPYYYLQQNDIIYVEPNKAQARSSYFSTTSSIWLSITSALVSLSTLIIAITK